MARACQVGNHLPAEFFIESAKTIIGAICGHRITPSTNRGQETRFYTTLASEAGGDGKSEACKWMMDMMRAVQLLYDDDRSPLGLLNVGAYVESFRSGRGMVEAFFEHSRILQTYDELSTMVEAFNIQGSGGSFMGLTTEMYESNRPPKSRIGKTKSRPATAPATCHNSILSCTIKEKRDEMHSSGVSGSGWFQRETLVATEEVETVVKLVLPDLSAFGAELFNRIMVLDTQRVEIVYTPAADKMLEDWFFEFRQRTKEDSPDIKGRINVLVQRNAQMLTWLLASGTDVDGDLRIIECDEDVVRRAIWLGEYQLSVRRDNTIPGGVSHWAKCENIIAKHLAQAGGRRMAKRVLVRKAHLSQYGIKTVDASLMNLLGNKAIAIYDRATVNCNGRAVPISDEEAVKLPDTIFMWTGDARSADKGWEETRGGDRRSPYVQKKKDADDETNDGEAANEGPVSAEEDAKHIEAAKRAIDANSVNGGGPLSQNALMKLAGIPRGCTRPHPVRQHRADTATVDDGQG